ncbi:MAG: TetR/AcrR family transcriptional regulator [Alphaproteobacteria bacterium]
MGKPADQIGEAPAEDGRRKRGDQSRRKIVDAMIALVREGEMSPSAAQVAERASVGLRTVFRHFDEMEILYREIAEVTRARILPALLKPYVGLTWQENLNELIARRIAIYEDIMPLKVAGSVLRFRSPFLMEGYNEHLRMERKTLKQVLPDNLVEDRELFRALEMVTSFQAWRRLRQDQGLGVGEANRVIHRLVAGVLPASASR